MKSHVIRRATERRGFALLGAIWIMVALSALAMQIAVPARARRHAVINADSRARARAAAYAALDHARARLAQRIIDRSGASYMAAAGTRDFWRGAELLLPDTIALGASQYRATLTDAGARLNVNRASENSLRRLFTALRIDAGVADRLAQAIVDWRDPDDLVHARGAERGAYLDAGLRAVPRNAAFARIDEVRDVVGMTPELFALVRQYVTTEGSGSININAASIPVLLSLPGFTEEAAAAAVRLREASVAITNLEQFSTSLSSGSRRALLDANAELRAMITFETRELEAESEAWVENSAVRVVARCLFVRDGTAMFLTARRTEP